MKKEKAKEYSREEKLQMASVMLLSELLDTATVENMSTTMSWDITTDTGLVYKCSFSVTDIIDNGKSIFNTAES